MITKVLQGGHATCLGAMVNVLPSGAPQLCADLATNQQPNPKLCPHWPAQFVYFLYCLSGLC